MEKNTSLSITSMELSIAMTVVATMLVCHVASMLGWRIQALSACTGAVMCVQDSKNASWCVGKNRMLGVVCGGAAGMVVVLLDNLIGIALVFYLLMGVGVLLNLVLCKLVELPLVQARVSCMSLMLVALVLQGGVRINYAFGRFLGTLVGALVALLVSMLWEKLLQKEKSNVY